MTRRDKRQWLILLIVAILTGVSRGAFLALINAAIAAGGSGKTLLLYAPASLMIIAIILGGDFFAAVRGKALAARMTVQVRDGLMDRISSANLQTIESEGVSDLLYNVMYAAPTVADALILHLNFANGIVTLVFNVIYIGFLSPLGFAMAVAIVIAGVTVHSTIERTNQSRRHTLDGLWRDSQMNILGHLEGFKELRLAAVKSADYREILEGIHRKWLGETITEMKFSSLGVMTTSFFLYLAMATIGLLLPALVSVKPVTAMQLLSAILFTMGPLVAVITTFGQFGRAGVALGKIKRLSATIDAIREPRAVSCRLDLPAFEQIELKNIAFAFPKEKDRASGNEEFHLGPIDLTIRRGDIVCLAGGNGSGKTVLMRVLTGLYRPTGGTILYNGTPVSENDRQAYREQFSTVFGDFHLFKELLGHRDPQEANVAALLEKYDLKGKTAVTDGAFTSVELSAGQRKRLALIVSILDRRSVMVLDEFGADQDPEHRHRFYREWLGDLKAMGKTVIVVSHDDRYFDAADRIIRLDFGRVVEDRRVRSEALNSTQGDKVGATQ
ncbi:MAG: cyclic peptide export ABC transporter [Alphaproteobacteria bacterium]|nr:cyclic peptide export ABC transporter [Alphaproteobacteria bacterium]